MLVVSSATLGKTSVPDPHPIVPRFGEVRTSRKYSRLRLYIKFLRASVHTKNLGRKTVVPKLWGGLMLRASPLPNKLNLTYKKIENQFLGLNSNKLSPKVRIDSFPAISSVAFGHHELKVEIPTGRL